VRAMDLRGTRTVTRDFRDAAPGVELGVEDRLPGTVLEAAPGKRRGGFEHNGIGMGFDACLGTRQLLAGGSADSSRQPALILILANQT
jgi:hypothetical protein